MADEITNTVASETPVTPVVNEENVVVNQEPQVAPQENVEENIVENSNQEQVTEQTEQVETQPVQPTTEQLQARLKEYEVRDEEERMMREKLGIKDMDQQVYNNMNLDQQVVNQGKQAYLRLCNEYGIDADPNNIDSSLAKMKETDPARAYEFQKRFEDLGNEVYNKRQYIQRQTTAYEINKFQNEYNQLLEASPALNNIMTQYVQTYGHNTNNMYQQLNSVINTILPAYQEAFEAGKLYALQGKAKQDTSPVSGGIATGGSQSVSSGNTFTRDQISRMSTEEFAKYEREIQRQMMEGKIY